MQDRPSAAELLRDVAELLEGDVLAAVSGPLQHNVRVAGNLTRIVQRELELGPAADARANELLRSLLDRDGTADELIAELADRLRRREDAALAQNAFPALLEITRAKLAIVKPGHDEFTGE